MTHTYVPPKGAKDARYVIVAEQPGRVEVERREPFVGPAGENLTACLASVPIARSECYLTNVVKDLDAPLNEYIRLRKKTALVSDAGRAYITALRDELAATSANVIVACGNVALYALTGRIGIQSWRGSVLESTLLPGRKVIPTIHPAIYTTEKLFRDPALFLWRYVISRDLKRAAYESHFPEIRRTARTARTRPTFDEALVYLRALRSRAIVFFDIELYENEMSCIGVAGDETDGMCIPFIHQDGLYFTLDEEREIMRALAAILEDDGIMKCAHNAIFDTHFLHDRYGILTRNVHDTMIAQGIIYPEFKKRLEFVTSWWTDIPYYKNDGKIWLRGGSNWDNGFLYNVNDVFSIASALPQQLATLERTQNAGTYARQTALIEPLTYMMEHGVRVDIAGMQRAHDELAAAVQLNEAMLSLAMPNINTNSVPQLKRYFYETCGIKPITNKYDKITVDENALRQIAASGRPEAALILDIRKKRKQMRTFLNTANIDRDGRMRCYYNPVGTKYGRISSTKNIYGTGMNLMNVPMKVREFFLADENHVLYSLDLSQAENRVVAYVGNITQMIDVFRRGLDTHRMTGALIFRKDYACVSDEPGSSTIGDGTYSERDWAKRANHAFNYGFGPKSFALLHEISYAEAKRLHSAYHTAYPGIRNSYWRYVRETLTREHALTTLFGRRIAFYKNYNDPRFAEKVLNEAYSVIPQGTVGEMINERGIKFIYYHDDPIYEHAEILTQVHDSVDFQISLNVPLETHARIILGVIASLEMPLTWRQQSFVIPCDLTINTNMNKKSASAVNIKSGDIPRIESALARCIAEYVESHMRSK